MSAEQKNHMKLKELEELAQSLDWECIRERGGTGVVVAPVLRDDEGRPLVRYYPDPCEFNSLDRALEILLKEKERTR